MSIYQTSKADIALLLTAKASGGVTFTENDFDIIAMRATTGADATAFNTKIVLQMRTTSAYRGVVYLFYDRLNLASLANFLPMDSDRYVTFADVDTSIYNLLNNVRDAVGVQFTTDDLVETQTEADDDGVIASLQAKTTSLGWYGSVNVKFSGLPNIINAFNARALPGF